MARLYGYSNIDKYELKGTFQHVVSTAALAFDVPMAFVNLVEMENILIKASVGFDGNQRIAREIGLCSLAILKDEFTVYKDTHKEIELKGNPMVHGEFGLGFYAAAPLKTPDGFNIGVVAIADKAPREFSEEDGRLLEGLASIVMEELEYRLEHRKN
ncbi:GAF domain-containing protein [Rufibacter sp. LB8]|uniref:GAF domain-containing protein n=1 Tax=Rufibacter sp. LB8 TaxID=2777781 RepID=UPI001CEFA066|nr:GAF domain-containing protein [Rufibacter sp. LB8]